MITRTSLAIHDLGPDIGDFRADVLRGLSQPQKRIPSKYFYDDEGSRLFDRICQLDEYYPTRAELAVMREHANEMAAALGSAVVLIEYGSGSSVKTRCLLDALERPATYLPVDISRDHLLAAADRIAAAYRGLDVIPVVADFTRRFSLPIGLPAAVRRVAYFPGSTIGNFRPRQATLLLRQMAELVGPDGAILLGIDLKKDPAVLHRAYNDAAGVTAAFNKNLLRRINRELAADIRPYRFHHHAFYTPRYGRIEMHLVSRTEQTASIDGVVVRFAEGESILTEYSYKFTVREFHRLAARAGLRPSQIWLDSERRFAVQLLETKS